MINLKVELGEKSYPIFIGLDSLEKLGEMLKIYDLAQQVMVITDANVHKFYAETIHETLKPHLKSFQIIKIRSGEKSKSLSIVNHIITQMLEQGYDKKAVVLAFGGGVVGDVAGFVASVYKRGIRLVQVPTTLLAQVDSSIGGKTGVNHNLGKNLIGTIYQPKMVWSDPTLLKTLPRREIICGLGEIIKYGIIQDAQLFNLIEESLDEILALDLDLIQDIIKRCCEIKADIVAYDEYETGLRMILNFGHTVGHALEAVSDYKKLSHGEAVLLGMLAESKMAVTSELLSTAEFHRIKNLIARFDLKGKAKNLDSTKIIDFMQNDKKALAGNLRFVLPEKIGKVCVVENVKSRLIKTGLKQILTH